MDLNLPEKSLVVFIDDTGHEALVKGHPVYGLGGCAAMAHDLDRLVRHPWHEVLRKVAVLAMPGGTPGTRLVRQCAHPGSLSSHRPWPEKSALWQRPKRQLKAAGPSIQLIDRNPSGCPLTSLRNMSGERNLLCNSLQSCKATR